MILMEGLFFIVPILLVLKPATTPLAVFSLLRLIWGPLIHMNIDLRWPKPFSYILSSPFTHRWHHSKENERCNYAGIFILWDVIYGTFYSPEYRCKETGFTDEQEYPRHILTRLIYPLNKLFKKTNTE